MAIILAVTATGCAVDGPNHELTSHRPYSAADVTFARQVIAHHRRAINTSALARGRTKSPALQRIVDGTSGQRSLTIAALTELLSAWDESVPQPSGSPAASSGDDGGTAPPTLRDDEAGRLRALSGAAFDRLLLGLMIEQHRGAMTLSRLELEVGTSPGARSIATSVEAGLSAEITTMQKLLSLMPTAPPG